MYGTATINDRFEFTQFVSTSNDASDQVPLTQPSARTNAPNNTTNEHQYTQFETPTIRGDTFPTPTAPRATPRSSVHNSQHEDPSSNPQSLLNKRTLLLTQELTVCLNAPIVIIMLQIITIIMVTLSPNPIITILMIELTRLAHPIMEILVIMVLTITIILIIIITKPVIILILLAIVIIITILIIHTMMVIKKQVVADHLMILMIVTVALMTRAHLILPVPHTGILPVRRKRERTNQLIPPHSRKITRTCALTNLIYGHIKFRRNIFIKPKSKRSRLHLVVIFSKTALLR